MTEAVFSLACTSRPLFQLIILLEQGVQLVLELLDLRLVLVLDAEVVHLDLNVTNLSAQAVLLLLVAHNRVKHAFQVLDLVVDFLDQLVLCLLVHSIFDLDIHLLDLLHQSDSAFTNTFDLVKDSAYLAILALEVLNEPIDALEVLVAVDVLGHCVPLLLHILQNLLLMFRLLNDCLELLLQVLDLVLFVAELNALVRDLLPRHHNLLIYRLLEVIPLHFELLKLIINGGDLGL